MTRNSSSRLEGQSDQFRQGWRTNIENGLKVLLSLCFCLQEITLWPSVPMNQLGDFYSTQVYLDRTTPPSPTTGGDSDNIEHIEIVCMWSMSQQ